MSPSMMSGTAMRRVALPLCLLLLTPTVRAQEIQVDVNSSRRISGESGGLLRFSAIGTIRVARSGHVAVLDPTDNRLVLFNPDGQVVGLLEAKGRGPRELAALSDVCGDPQRGLRVLDPTGPKVGFVDTSGRVVSERVLGARAPVGIACPRGNPGASLVSVELGTPSPADDKTARLPEGLRPVVFSATLRVWSAENESPKSVTIPIFADMLALGGGGMPRPLGRGTTVRISDEGTVFVVRGDSAIVQVLASSGAVRSTFRLRPRSVRPTAADVASAIDDLLERVPRAVQSRLRALLEAFPPPRDAPTHRAAVLDDRGRLWVQRSLPSEANTTIEVYSPDGRVIDTIVLPRGLTLHDVNGGWLAMSQRDADGASFVQLHRVNGR